MASLVLPIPSGMVSSQCSSQRHPGAQALKLAFDPKFKSGISPFKKKCLFGLPGSLHHGKRFSVILKSSENASVETAAGGVLDIEDEASFNQYLQEAGEKLVVLDISTQTCGPCKMIYPKVVKMSKEYPDAVFLKINGDLNKDTRALMRKWGVRAVPNFRFFRNGKLIHSHTGANEDELRAKFLVHYMEKVQV